MRLATFTASPHMSYGELALADDTGDDRTRVEAEPEPAAGPSPAARPLDRGEDLERHLGRGDALASASAASQRARAGVAEGDR